MALPLPCPGGWRLALDWAGHPLEEYEAWALGKLPRQRSGGHRRQQSAAGPSAHWPERPRHLPHTQPHSPPASSAGAGPTGKQAGLGGGPRG